MDLPNGNLMYHIKTKTIQGGRENEKRLRIVHQKNRKENGNEHKLLKRKEKEL